MRVILRCSPEHLIFLQTISNCSGNGYGDWSRSSLVGRFSHVAVHCFAIWTISWKCTFGSSRPGTTQISLRIRAVWSESSLGAFCIAKELMFLVSDSEDSDQTARIWVFAWRTYIEKKRFSRWQSICYTEWTECHTMSEKWPTKHKINNLARKCHLCQDHVTNEGKTYNIADVKQMGK